VNAYLILMNQLRTYIETVLETYLLEETSNQPTEQAFSMDRLRSLSQLQQVIGYCSQTLGSAKIRQKQGRTVYSLGNAKVLKVANSHSGLQQNVAEISVCKTPENVNIFPEIYESNNQGYWLVAEEAAPMTRVTFKSLTGVPWNEFIFALGGAFPRTASDASTGELRQYQLAFEKHYTNPFFRRVVNLIKNCNYEPGDLVKIDSWGLARGLPVVVDSGYTAKGSKG